MPVCERFLKAFFGISLFEVCVALFIVSATILPLCDRMEASVLLTAQQQKNIQALYARV